MRLLLRVTMPSLLLAVLFSYPNASVAQTGEPSETIRIDSDLVDLKVSVV